MTAIQTLLERAERVLPANPAVVPVFGDLPWPGLRSLSRPGALCVGTAIQTVMLFPLGELRFAWSGDFFDLLRESYGMFVRDSQCDVA